MKKKVKTIKATYVSVWDGSTQIRTNCDYNPETKLVTNIGQADVDGMDLECLEDEYVELPDGTIVRDFDNPDAGSDESCPLSVKDIEFLRKVVDKNYNTPEQD